MAERKIKLTDASVERNCPLLPLDSEKTQVIFWDKEYAGFGLLVGRKTRSWIVQKPIEGRTVRLTIGRFPTWRARDARRKALKLLRAMDAGIDPRERKRRKAEEARKNEWQRFTLRQALEEHIASMKAASRSERSIKKMRDELTRHVADWMDTPLVQLRRADCIDRHRAITTSAGPVQANRTLRMVRACWNSARRRFEELPEHPVRVVFNTERRRREPITWDDLPAWAENVNALTNPVRRDLNWFLLLTGLRSEDARTVGFDDVNWLHRTLHRPNPKGGEQRAFTIPLSPAAIALLRRRRMENGFLVSDDRGWAFPTRNRDGHVTHVQEPKQTEYFEDALGRLRKRTTLPSPHRLRDTFATACMEAELDILTTKILMNHVPPENDVTLGYMRPSTGHLRSATERVTKFLIDKAGVGPADLELERPPRYDACIPA